MRTAALALVLLATGSSLAQAPAWAEKMFKEGVVHDFGTVPRGTPLHHAFSITNIYAVRMEITSISPLCSCVTASASKLVLEPRETAAVEVTMDTRRFAGKKAVIIRVSVGPHFVSTAELRVSAESKQDVVCNPGELNFGTISQGSTSTQSLKVEYAGMFDWKITEVTVGDVPVKAAVEELERTPGKGASYRLNVTLADNAPPGTIRQDIFLKTNDPAAPLLPVPVAANIQTSLFVTPSDLKLAGAKVGEQLKRRVVVRAGREFKIKAVDGLGNGLALGQDLDGKPALVHIVSFTIQPSAPGTFQRELQIRTDVQEKPISLTISGDVVQ